MVCPSSLCRCPIRYTWAYCFLFVIDWGLARMGLCVSDSKIAFLNRMERKLKTFWIHVKWTAYSNFKEIGFLLLQHLQIVLQVADLLMQLGVLVRPVGDGKKRFDWNFMFLPMVLCRDRLKHCTRVRLTPGGSGHHFVVCSIADGIQAWKTIDLRTFHFLNLLDMAMQLWIVVLLCSSCLVRPSAPPRLNLLSTTRQRLLVVIVLVPKLLLVNLIPNAVLAFANWLHRWALSGVSGLE